VFAALALLPLLAADDGSTVVRARAVDDVDDVRVPTGAPGGLWDGGAALLFVPGAAIARDGGPLAPVRPVLRGLSGARLDVDALGLPLNDPAAGIVDLALLPWGMGDIVVDTGAGKGVAGTLSLRAPPPGIDVAVGVGDLSTLRGRLRGAGTHEGGRVAGFVDVGTTRGDFAFDNDDALGTGGPPAVRRNNDQQRANAAATVDVDVGPTRVAVAAAAGLRRGGVPGFATAPLSLRAQDALVAVGGRLATRALGARVDVGVDATGSDRLVTGDVVDSRLTGARAGASARIAARLDDDFDVAFAARADRSGLTGVVERNAGRATAEARFRQGFGAIVTGIDATLGGDVIVDTDTDIVDVADVDTAADAASPATTTLTLPRGTLRLRLGRGHDDAGDVLEGFVGVSRASRAPTLDERFAPRGFFRGNAALRPEFVDEVEAGVVVGTRGARARATAHASTLRDVIVIVHKNAFEVGPENTGAATRAGLDVGLSLQPLALLAIDVSAGILASALSSTGAPLPGAPPVVFALAPRVGDGDGWVRAVIAARGPVSSTLFGTLQSPGSVLVDVDGRVPLGRGLAAAVTVQNAFDVRDARDLNLLPLPGRLVFVSLEVHA
jgi:hypothetical protein